MSRAEADPEFEVRGAPVLGRGTGSSLILEILLGRHEVFKFRLSDVSSRLIAKIAKTFALKRNTIFANKCNTFSIKRVNAKLCNLLSNSCCVFYAFFCVLTQNTLQFKDKIVLF